MEQHGFGPQRRGGRVEDGGPGLAGAGARVLPVRAERPQDRLEILIVADPFIRGIQCRCNEHAIVSLKGDLT